MAVQSPIKHPLFDTPQVQIAPLKEEIERRIAAVIDSGRFILGPEVAAFEKELAAFLGAEHAIGVANGTDGLTIALRALGVGEGDDVVVPSFTFYATAEAVPHVGARPVFCDVDPETFCITADAVERAMTPATRAIVAVHLFGMPAPLVELRALARSRRVHLIEDAAQAVGARLDGSRVGALGDAAVFSFFPSKNLFCLGDGGAIVTSDAEVAERAALLRRHCTKDKERYVGIGYNSRLDEIQAAVLRVLLPELDGWNERRRALAAAYIGAGLDQLVEVPKPLPGVEAVHHLYVVRSERRAALAAALREAGIESRALYETPVHRQPPMAAYSAGVELPGTDAAARTNLALPMGPMRTAETARAVVDAIEHAARAHSAASR
jgi:dTDP-4-amino-4,6-dideoxygalactose transaminase